MMRIHFIKTISILFVALATNSASAASAEQQAQTLIDQAINEDYLEMSFDTALTKLKKAAKTCGACAKSLRAQIHGAQGIVLIAGLQRINEGKAEFAKALALDPNFEPDPDLSSDRISAAFKEVKQQGGVAPAAAPAPLRTPVRTSVPASAPQNGTVSSENMQHEAPQEQVKLTPVPLYVELSAGLKTSNVKLYYRAFGTTNYKSIALRTHGTGHSASIPCSDVGTITGKLRYYLQATNADGSVLAWSGSPSTPHVIAIVDELSGKAPHLPGQTAPSKCVDTTDCPPDFPGCQSERQSELEGWMPCENNEDCRSGYFCDGASCKRDDNNEASSWAKNWISLTVQQDFLFFGSDTGICSGGNQYYCFYEGDSYYAGLPQGGEGVGNEVSSGVGAATTRLMLGYDRSFLENFAVGARVGYVFGGGPNAPESSPFIPVHAELRGAYWFGSQPFGNSGVKPYLFLSGGMAQIDARVLVTVYDGDSAYANDERTKLNAWRKTGTGFASAGGGAAFKFNDWNAILAEAKVMQLFGASGTAMSFNVGYSVGL